MSRRRRRNLNQVKRQYIREHSLGHLTIAQLQIQAKRADVFIYGDKAQILQCFDQSKTMFNLFRDNRL